MGQMKNRALMDWMDKQGYVKGREWMTQRLPRNLVLKIRDMAERRNLSPAEMIETAFRGNPELSPDFGLFDEPHFRYAIVGQQMLQLD